MDYTFSVKRTRSSVTQGSATVYLNGDELTTFGDTIELIKEGQPYYGDLIGGWASVKPDSSFISAALWHPVDDYYWHSQKAKNYITKEDENNAKYITSK